MKIIDSLKKLRRKEAIAISETEDIKKLTSRDAMIKPVFLYPDDNANKIIKKLKKGDTNICIVVTKNNRFLGEINDEDIIKLFLHQAKYESLAQILNIGYRREFLYKKAKELINKHKSTVNINTPINKIMGLMYKGSFQYIPVLDNNKKVVGVVTPSNLINLLQKY